MVYEGDALDKGWAVNACPQMCQNYKYKPDYSRGSTELDLLVGDVGSGS